MNFYLKLNTFFKLSTSIASSSSTSIFSTSVWNRGEVRWKPNIFQAWLLVLHSTSYLISQSHVTYAHKHKYQHLIFADILISATCLKVTLLPFKHENFQCNAMMDRNEWDELKYKTKCRTLKYLLPSPFCLLLHKTRNFVIKCESM